MAAARKARSDAVLKTLPDPVQDQLFAICRAPGGYKAAKAWLKKEHDVTVKSDATLSHFFSWYPFSRPLEMAARFAKQTESAIKANPTLEADSEKIAAMGQIAFEQMAVQMQDLKGFVSLQKVRLKKIDQRHDDRRIKLLETRAALADKAEGVVKDKSLSAAERSARLREIFGM